MKHFLAAAAIAIGSVSVAHSAVIQNGSFEDSVLGDVGVGVMVTAVNHDITGWTISDGDIDYMGTYWEHSDGNRSIDLGGKNNGTIETTITGMTMGRVYALYFDMSGNPGGFQVGSPSNKIMDVTVEGTTVQYSYDTEAMGNWRENMKWVTHRVLFEATAPTTRLAFASAMDPSNAYGPAIDNIRLAEVPLPAGGLLMATGLFGLAMMRRRKKAA